MGSRIVTLQRQLRELGRIRIGYSEPYTKDGKTTQRPVRSRTFVLTSPNPAYLTTAAERYGGTAEQWQPLGQGGPEYRLITESPTLDAVLPPGDPVTQAYELWNRGGCVRRCDGETDTLSRRSCLCRAEYGEEWYLLPPTKVCRPQTRINFFLGLPDIGYWRLDTKSFYAAMELTATVDLIKASIAAKTGGANVGVRVRLRIDPRERVVAGRIKRFPVVVIELADATTIDILSGVIPTVGGGALGATPAALAVALDAPVPERAAIAAPDPAPPQQPEEPDEPTAVTPDPDAIAAGNWDYLTRIWDAVRGNPALRQVWWQRRGELRQQAAGEDMAPPPRTVDVSLPAEDVPGETEPDRMTCWQMVLTAGYQCHGWDLPKVTEQFSQWLWGKYGNKAPNNPSDATGWDIAEFLELLK